MSKKPYRTDPRNARAHPERNQAMIRQSLEEIGGGRSILVGGEGHVIAGNGVYEQAQKLGLTIREVEARPDELIAVKRADLVGERAVRAAILDNATGETSEWEWEQLRQLQVEYPDVLAGMDELAAEFEQQLAAAYPAEGGGGDEFDTTPTEGETRCKTGDLWLIGGKHRLLIGDCTDPANVARLMDGERADAVITDPPYSSGGFTRGDRTSSVDKKYSGKEDENRPVFSGDNRDQRSWVGWCERWIALWSAQCRDGAATGLWTDWRQLPATTDAAQGGGIVWRGVAVWDKTTSARPMYGRFRAQCEYLVWGSLGDMPLNNGQEAFAGVITQAVDNGKVHITQKPIDVIVWTFSIVAPSGLIADPFLGSGTAIIAAHRTNRRCYGMEISEQYGDVILRRCEAEGLEVAKIGELSHGA